MPKSSAGDRDRAPEALPGAAYRTNARQPARKRAPRELVYSSPETDWGMVAFGKLWLLIFSIPLLAYVVVSPFAGPLVGLFAAAAAAALTLRRRRSASRASGKVLYVEKGVLSVAPRAGKERVARFPLKDLDVVLDTKTIRKVVDGDSMLPAVRFTDSKVGPEIDMARIVLTNGYERHALSDHFASHTEALEWFGKIRVFLRRHGWVPSDERDGADL